MEQPSLKRATSTPSGDLSIPGETAQFIRKAADRFRHGLFVLDGTQGIYANDPKHEVQTLDLGAAIEAGDRLLKLVQRRRSVQQVLDARAALELRHAAYDLAQAIISIDQLALPTGGILDAPVDEVRDMIELLGTCPNCQGERWVCETHPDRPWDDDLPGGCTCDAGAPCPLCNPGDRDHPPVMPPGFEVIATNRPGEERVSPG